jgi:hypothetical protein
MPLVMWSMSKEIPARGAEQSQRMHTVPIKLACYVFAGQFPVVGSTLHAQTGEWR